MRPPKLRPDSPDYAEQVQQNIDMIWNAIEQMKGIGGRTIRLLGPLDMTGQPVLNTAAQIPAKHAHTHEYGQTDSINVAGLPGLLADPQTPPLMADGTRGGAQLGDVFALVSEVLTLSLQATMGIQKKDNALALKQQDPLPAITTADATEITSVVDLANELKAAYNNLLTVLKNAEIMPSYKGYFSRRYFALNYFSEPPDAYFSSAI
jgi:hypothetical protein